MILHYTRGLERKKDQPNFDFVPDQKRLGCLLKIEKRREKRESIAGGSPGTPEREQCVSSQSSLSVRGNADWKIDAGVHDSDAKRIFERTNGAKEILRNITSYTRDILPHLKRWGLPFA